MKVRPQTLHSKHWPPVCVRMCTANWDFDVNVIEHRSQVRGFSATCDHLKIEIRTFKCLHLHEKNGIGIFSTKIVLIEQSLAIVNNISFDENIFTYEP